MAEPLPRTYGRYILLERLAAGGMAEIFKARYGAGSIQKTIVIKRILPHLSADADFIAMFREEAKVTVRLSNANIVQVFEYGTEDGCDYLAMEYVPGHNLREILKTAARRGQHGLPIAFALWVAAESAKGLAHAHSRKDDDGEALGIIHRDVSPHNILISLEGEVKVADFGIAKARGRSIATRSGVMKGKVPYAAPEQIRGIGVDARADVYALGAVLWEMLAGRRLVEGIRIHLMMEEVLAKAPWPLVSSLRDGVNAELDQLVARAIEKDPEKRTPTTAALAKELGRWIARLEITSADVESMLGGIFSQSVSASDTVPLAPDPVHGEVTKRIRRGPLPTAGVIPMSSVSNETTASLGRTRMVKASEIPAEQTPRTGTVEIDDPTQERSRAAPSRTPALTGTFETPNDFILYAWGTYDGKPGIFIATDAFEHRPGTILRAVVAFRSPQRRFTIGVRVLWRRRKEVVEGGVRKRPGIAVELLRTAGDDLPALLAFCKIR